HPKLYASKQCPSPFSLSPRLGRRVPPPSTISSSSKSFVTIGHCRPRRRGMAGARARVFHVSADVSSVHRLQFNRMGRRESLPPLHISIQFYRLLSNFV